MSHSNKSMKNKDDDDFIKGIIADSLAMDENAYLQKMGKLLEFYRIFLGPVVTGVENIPEAPALFVANHSTLGGDTIVALPVVAEATGRAVRGMNDRYFYENALGRWWSISNSSVMGHPEIGSALLEAGKDLLVWPGGAYEALKDIDMRYKIQWKQRTGFVRMAAKHGVPIVPMAIVGPDDWYDHYMSRDELRGSVFGTLLKRAGVSEEYLNSDLFPPIPKGFMGTLLPKPKRAFIHFGKPISTSRFKGKKISQASQNKLRDQAKEQLEGAIEATLELREERRRERRGWLPRFKSTQ